jgi:hypothetical protein
MLLCFGKSEVEFLHFLIFFSKNFLYDVNGTLFLRNDVGEKWNVCGMGLFLQIHQLSSNIFIKHLKNRYLYLDYL